MNTNPIKWQLGSILKLPIAAGKAKGKGVAMTDLPRVTFYNGPFASAGDPKPERDKTKCFYCARPLSADALKRKYRSCMWCRGKAADAMSADSGGMRRSPIGGRMIIAGPSRMRQHISVATPGTSGRRP